MKYEWNLNLLCNDDSWKEKYHKLNEQVEKLNIKVEIFLDNINLFLEFINEYIKVNEEIEIIYCYPKRHLDIDLNNEKYKVMFNEALVLYQEILKLINKFENKLLDNSKEVNNYLKDKKCFKHKRYIYLILRRKNHILKDRDYKANYEAISQDIKNKYQSLFNNGFELEQLSLGDKVVNVNRFNYNDLMIDNNQNHRKIIFDAYTKEYEKCNLILTDLYLNKLKNDIELSKKEKYDSLLSKKLFELEIDNDIVEKLIEKVNENLYIMHDFGKLKKEILGLEELHFYDTSLSLCSIPKIEYNIEEAIKLMKNSLSILGNECINLIDRMFNEGWVDVFPKKDKRSSSFTCISYHGAPYILNNYDGSINSIRTLVHEFGHAMNVYYTKKNNDFEYFEFSYFLTEIASKVNEMLFNNYMLNNCKTEEEKIYILNNNIGSLGNSLFGQVMLTEFEYIIIQKLENNEFVNNDTLNEIYLEISKKYNGDEMIYEDNIKYGWSKIQHYIMQDSYYLYQYSIGTAIACNIAKRILDNESKILDKYIKFLSVGNSVSINEALSYIDIDLTNGDYLENALIILNDNIKKLRKIKL